MTGKVSKRNPPSETTVCKEVDDTDKHSELLQAICQARCEDKERAHAERVAAPM